MTFYCDNFCRRWFGAAENAKNQGLSPEDPGLVFYLMTRYGRLQAYLIVELSFDFSTGQPCHDQWGFWSHWVGIWGPEVWKYISLASFFHCHDRLSWSMYCHIHDIYAYRYSIIISCLFKMKVSFNIHFILIDLIVISGCQVGEFLSHKTKI